MDECLLRAGQGVWRVCAHTRPTWSALERWRGPRGSLRNPRDACCRGRLDVLGGGQLRKPLVDGCEQAVTPDGSRGPALTRPGREHVLLPGAAGVVGAEVAGIRKSRSHRRHRSRMAGAMRVALRVTGGRPRDSLVGTQGRPGCCPPRRGTRRRCGARPVPAPDPVRVGAIEHLNGLRWIRVRRGIGDTGSYGRRPPSQPPGRGWVHIAFETRGLVRLRSARLMVP